MSSLADAYAAFEAGDFLNAAAILSDYESRHIDIIKDPRYQAHRAIMSHPYSPSEAEASLRAALRFHWGALSRHELEQRLGSDVSLAYILYNLACCMVEQGNTVSAMQLLSYLVVAPAATDLGPMISALMLRAMIDSNSVLLSYLGGVEALGLCSELLLMCDTNLSAAAATAGAKLTDAEICSRINRVQAEILFNPCSENVMVMLESLNNSAAHLLGAISSSDLNSSIQRTSLLRYVSASSAESLCMFELSEGDVDKATAALRGRLSAVLSTLPSDPSSVAALMWARMTYFSNLGCLYFSGGRMFAAAEYSGKALEVCDKLLNSENRDALKKLRLVLPVVELLSNAGVAYLRTGRSVAARECFERLSHLRPREPVVWLRLAECMISTAFMTYSPGSKLAFSMKCVAGGTFTLLKCPARTESRSNKESIYADARRCLFRSLDLCRLQHHRYKCYMRDATNDASVFESWSADKSNEGALYDLVSDNFTQIRVDPSFTWRNMKQLLINCTTNAYVRSDALNSGSSCSSRLASFISIEGVENCKQIYQAAMIKLAFVNLKLCDFIQALSTLFSLLAGDCGVRLSQTERMLIVLYATEALCNIGEYALAIDLLSTPCLAVSKESTSSLTLRESLNQLILKSDSTCSTQRVTVLCECIGLSNQALILALQGKFQPAKDLLLLALGMEPTFYPAITLLISIYLRTKQYPAALSALRRYGSESSAP